MARKGWDALSDAYRKRLTRGGITKAGYEGGVKLQAARGQAKAEPQRSARKREAKQLRERAHRGALGMGLTESDWLRGLRDFTMAEIVALLDWKGYAHRERLKGHSMSEGTINPPTGELGLRFDTKNPWFWYGW